MRAVPAICLLLALSAPARADFATDIAQAATEIGDAAETLANAEQADDMMVALGSSVTAYENALRVLRDSFRATALRERELAGETAARRAEVSRLMGAIYSMESAPAPLLFLHPQGPRAAVEAAQLLTDLTPDLQRKTADLGKELAEITDLRILKDEAAANLRLGLAGLLNARAALEDSIAKGEPVPARLVEDPMQVQILAATSESLSVFASALSTLPLPPGQTGDFGNGTLLPLPVAGHLSSGFEQAGADGVKRPGLVLVAAPVSLVTSPADATVRFAGPFLDYGNVVILEPVAGTLLLMAGIDRLVRSEGDVLRKGDPLGFLGGSPETAEEFLIDASLETQVQAPKTLYIELRRNGSPVDPEPWFDWD